MESGNGGASSKGVLIPVPDSADDFQNSILAPLQSAYLYEESKQFFTYKSAVLIKNTTLEEKYNTFRAKRRELGYTEEDLKECFGFLLFDNVNEAHTLGESGVLTGNSSCTTLGDPSKGVYLSMYSDCLEQKQWYNGKTGYIAIIRLTKGKVKRVSENYTQNLIAPTEGFDCYVSEQLPSVTAKTSSFIAFERSQYYVYELLDVGSNKTAQCPSAACPFAVVSFSYTDTKPTCVVPPENSEVKETVSHYLPWSGELHIGSQVYSVGLRSTVALIPTKLPSVLKCDRAISMVDLRKLLPRTVFETCVTGEVFLDSLYCSLCELVSTDVEKESSLALLLCAIKENDLALTVPLNDGGFLILLHSSHFLIYDDACSSAASVLQVLFVFPESRVIVRDTKCQQRSPPVSSEILHCLPVLNYAESKGAKTPFDPNKQLCDVLMQHMQSYAVLINPGLTLSPSREVSLFPDQYDVPDAYKLLYSSPERTNSEWQSLKSYLSKPTSFQLPLSKALEIMSAGWEEQREDFDDDVYICLLSPEAPVETANMGLEDQLSEQKSPVQVALSTDSGISNAEMHDDSTAVPQNFSTDDMQAGDASKDSEKCCNLMELNKRGDTVVENLLTPTSDDLPAELIVSITSAEHSVTDETLCEVSTVPTVKYDEFQLSDFSTRAKAAVMTSVSDDMDRSKKVLNGPGITNVKKRKLRRGNFKGRRKTASLRTVTTPVETDLHSQKDAEGSLDNLYLKKPSGIHSRKLQRHKRKLGSLSSKTKNLRSSVRTLVELRERNSDQSLENTILKELEAYPLRKKTERWDLKPVISECGRILVPHGSADIVDKIQSLKDELQSTKDEQCLDKTLLEAPVSSPIPVEMEIMSSTSQVVVTDKTELADSMDGTVLLQNNVMSESDKDSCSVPLSPETNQHSSKKDGGTDTPPPQAVEENSGKSQRNFEFLLGKLKSVLLRGKRKTECLSKEEETAANTPENAEPCLKKGKVDAEELNCRTAATKDTSFVFKEVPNELSVDLFAHALGLTPKETADKVQKTEGANQRKDLTETPKQSISEQQTLIIQKPPSIFPRGCRIKTLKKHQGISTEYIKQKWWLHFQTPACITSEKHKDFTRDNSVRKTVKEKMNSACSSTDALNLLADLALGANNDQVPPQPNPALERKPETGLKKCDRKKPLSSAEQESVLHALLRQPTAKAAQPLESPSPSHLVAHSELVGLVNKEHAYSLPPSSSLLLDLPGSPFQVSPVSGSAGFLHHHQTMYSDGFRTLHPSVSQENRGAHNNRIPEYLKKTMMRRQKFRHSRMFVVKDRSVQVTRQWPENYDFRFDSKFTSDSKDRTVVRALHGPWDFTMQDTSEEVRLIVHMWIGLFYSRSTARFFHVDSNMANPCSQESSSLEVPRGVESRSTESSPKDNTFDCFQSRTDTSVSLTSEALDLSIKDNAVLNQESVILDLSLKNSNAEAVTSDPQIYRKDTSLTSGQKETSELLDSPKSPREGQNLVESTEIINLMKHIISTQESKMPPQKFVCLELRDLQPWKKGETRIISVEPESLPIPLGVGHGSNNENTVLKDGTDRLENRALVQKDGMDLSTSMIGKQVLDFSKKVNIVGQTHDLNKQESKNQESCDRNENQCQEGSVDSSHVGEGSGYKKPIPQEEPEALSPYQADNVNVSDDCSTTQEDENRFNDKDSCIRAMELEGDLYNQPLPNMCDGSMKEDCAKESNYQAPMDLQVDCLKVSCSDITLKTLNTDGAPLKDCSAVSPSEMKSIHNITAAGENSENNLTDESAACDGSVDSSLRLTTESLETANLSKEMPDTSFGLNVGHEEQEKTDNITLIEPFQQLPQTEVTNIGEAEVAITEEANLKINEASDEICCKVRIPFIGEETVQPHDCPSQEGSGLEQNTFASKAADPEAVQQNEVYSMPDGSHKISLPDESETDQLSENEFDNRCPTPTIDEKPYQYTPCSTLTRSTSVFGDSETNKNRSLSRSSTPVKDELPTLCHTSTIDSNSDQYQALHPDLELQTLRVLQSIDKFLFNSDYTDKPSQIETQKMKESLHQMANSSSMCTPGFLPPCQTTLNFKDMKKGNEKLPVASKDLHTESSDNFVTSPFKNKLEEVLGVKLQLKKAESSVPQHHFEQGAPSESHCHLHRSLPSAESLQTNKPNIEQDWHKTAPQSNLNHEPRPYSQRPVMAVKPSKSEESQTDLHIENFPRNKATKMAKKAKEIVSGHSEDLNNDKPEGYKSSCPPNPVEAKLSSLEPSVYHSGSDMSKYNSPSSSSSLSVKSFETANCSPKPLDGDQAESLMEKVKKESIEMDQRDFSDLPASVLDHKYSSISDDGLSQAPQSSLVCTVYNSNRKRSCSFLENLSQRCLQEDPTQSSVEQECLIFSEQMKQLLKRIKRGSGHQQDTHNGVISCASPVTVQFSSLEEQDDSLDDLDMSLTGQKIKVDMSDRRNLSDTNKEEMILNPEQLSQGTENPVEHAGVSGLTVECARAYEAAMDDVCHVKKLQSQPKGFRIPNTEQSNHFDFCDQMKREMDEAFLSNLNSVVKKSCKTKYRFYILAPTDDIFFEETKVQLEEEGHTSVQPSEFFIGEDNSSSLLIILRNEDIAEHICEVPHLLELKKSPGVQFAGIDEPNDVVNLTHQELFIRGGFLMFDKAALETLSVCNMKKVFDILQELNRSGKWKWMLHYRDSRWLKETARLNEEAKEKKNLLYWGQDTGILDVLPYHECDQMSRPQPDYLTCLARLQTQNILSRYPVFITDMTTDSAFERNGIFTLTLNSFLTKSPSETFTV